MVDDPCAPPRNDRFAAADSNTDFRFWPQVFPGDDASSDLSQGVPRRAMMTIATSGHGRNAPKHNTGAAGRMWCFSRLIAIAGAV
jgi:hypothetical protein